jgi:hypothetical protein
MSDNEFAVFLLICLILSATILLITADEQTESSIIFIARTDGEQENLVYTLPYTGIGGDYLIYYSDGSPEGWLTSWIVSDMALFKANGYHTARLGFVFSDCSIQPLGRHGMSVYDQTKMDRVLEIFDAYGIKVVLLLQNNYDCEEYAGSTAWRNNWLSVATHYKNDNRIVAFSIFGEPQHNTYDNWAPAITTDLQFHQSMMDLIDDIHAIDPDRVCIFPFTGLQDSSAASRIADLQAVGADTDTYTLIDCTHPYFFENSYDMGLTPTQKVSWYDKNEISPFVVAFGASKLWCGETFYWGGLTPSLQREWTIGIVNKFVQRGVGFDFWAYWGTEAITKNATKEALAASNYGLVAPPEPEPPISPPPPSYYYGTVTATTGGQVHPAGAFTQPVGLPWWCVAIPNADYVMGRWERNGVTVSTNLQYSMGDGVKDQTYNIVAYFTANLPIEPDPPDPPADPLYFTVNVQAQTGGTVSPSGTQTVVAGQSLTVVATPKENYRFNYWLQNNVNVSSNKTYSLAGAANTTYTLLAVFQYVSPPPPNEFILPSGDNVAIIGRSKTFQQIKKQAVDANLAAPKFADITKILRKLKI